MGMFDSFYIEMDGRVQSIIASTRRLQAGESIGGKLGLLFEEDKKLAAGEDPLEVIAWALSDEARSGWFRGGGTQMDPLEVSKTSKSFLTW